MKPFFYKRRASVNERWWRGRITHTHTERERERERENKKKKLPARRETPHFQNSSASLSLQRRSASTPAPASACLAAACSAVGRCTSAPTPQSFPSTKTRETHSQAGRECGLRSLCCCCLSPAVVLSSSSSSSSASLCRSRIIIPSLPTSGPTSGPTRSGSAAEPFVAGCPGLRPPHPLSQRTWPPVYSTEAWPATMARRDL